MKYIKTLIPLLVLTMLFACNDDMDDTIDSTDDMPVSIEMNEFDSNFVQNFGAQINRDFIVHVVDASNTNLSNVTVTIGNTTEITDENGRVIIRDAQVYQRFGYIKASKPGFIHASRSVAPTSGTNNIKIMMLPETITGVVESGEEAVISNGQGSQVMLRGDYINETGQAYEGNVNVILHHLDPTNDDTEIAMPGMLYAQNTEGQERMLQTMGMLAVELRGDNNEDLNLAPGSTAEIRMPVDSTLLSMAPSTIPLWYFDETNGVWIEEGEATLENGEYVGLVSHFSFWNCDIPTEANIICINIVDEDGNPLANQIVTITSENFGTTAATTNGDGQVCGYMPSNETLELNVLNNDICNVGNSYFTTNIGPFTSDETVTIAVTLPSTIITETVTGQLSECDGAPVTNGYTILNYGGIEAYSLVTDGTFEINVIRCQDDLEFTLKGIDIDNIQETETNNYTFTTPTTNVGQLLACSDVTEFIQYDLDNGAITFFATENIYVYFTEGTATTLPQLSISADDNDNGIYLFGQLFDTPPYTGIYDSLDWQDPMDTGFNIDEFFGNMENSTMEYNVTAFGNVGEYIDISFSGTYDDSNGINHTLTGTVHVLRNN